MIYQSDKSYKFFLFSASFLGKEQYVVDKIEFETNLLRQLQEEENMLAMTEERTPLVVLIPTIVYTDITHTGEEIDRLAECQDSNGQLDDVKYYVLNGSFPNSAHSLLYLETKILKTDNESMKTELSSQIQLSSDFMDYAFENFQPIV